MNHSKVAFIPVDNGNMTLIKLADSNKTTILIDMNIRKAADNDAETDYYDASGYLRKHLETDGDGRPVLDILIVTHLDNDHIGGLQTHFHLGDPDEYKSNEIEENPKIIIGEMWSTTRYQKNHSSGNPLSEDAKAFKKEMRRRVELARGGGIQDVGNKALILGDEHEEGACSGVEHITHKCGKSISVNTICSALVLGPLAPQDDEDKQAFLDSRNRGSVIVRFGIKAGSGTSDILTTADGTADVWKYTWRRYRAEDLQYDIMSAPHHCSWHSISYDQDAKKEVDTEAFNALSQCKEGAYIVSQSQTFGKETPPHKEARKEYEGIVGKEYFLCTAEEPKPSKVEPIEFELYGDDGVDRLIKESAKASSMVSIAKEPLGHG